LTNKVIAEDLRDMIDLYSGL